MNMGKFSANYSNASKLSGSCFGRCIGPQEKCGQKKTDSSYSSSLSKPNQTIDEDFTDNGEESILKSGKLKA
jgi:hypothetical protein